MKHDSTIGRHSESSGTTGFAVFDENDCLLETNAALIDRDADALKKLEGCCSAEVLKFVLQDLSSIDGQPVKQTKAFLKKFVRRWSAFDGAPLEAQTMEGSWKLLTSHPRPGGGTALISVDMTELKQAQIKLHENEEVFRCITESHPLPVWMADEDTGEILYESIEASRILGRDWDQSVPQFIGDHYANPEDREVVKKQLHKHGILRDYIARFKKADGTKIWISANVRLGTFRGRRALIAGIVDVTARKEREDQIKFMLEGHPLPVAMNEVESGRMILESRAAAQMFGRDPDSGIQAYSTDHYVNPQDRERLIAQLREHGSVNDFEALWKRNDGSQFWAKINVRLVEFDGREVMLAGVLDVTEQKERENELTRARELLADAVESISEGFALYDEDERFVMCNSAYAEMNKVVADILEPGMRWEHLLHVSAHRGEYPEAIGREEEWLAERLDSRAKYNQNHEFQHADGRWYSVSIHQTRLGGFVVTRTDITERKQNEATQREAEEVVRQVVEACPAALEMRRISDGEFLYRSPAAVALLGARVDLAATYVDPQDQQDLHKYLQKHGEVFDQRMQLKNADGQPFWASVSARYIVFRGDLVIVSTISDLTERVRIEQGFKRASELLTDAIESLTEGFALFDADKKLVMCNTRYKQMNHVIEDHLNPGLSWDVFLRTGAERGQFLDAIGREEQWIEERKARVARHDEAYEYQQSDGRWYSGLSSATREGGFVLTRVDITERRQMEEAQREADAVVRQVIDDCPVALEMRNLETGECIFRSPGAADLLGERKHPSESYVHPADRAPSLRMLKDDGEARNRRLLLKRSDDTPFWASVSARVTEFRDQKVVVSTISDLTEQVLVEEERNRAHELLADAIESLAEGFALYSSDNRLVMCNSRYRQMNESIADLLLPGASWHELFKAGVERGQYVGAAESEEYWIKQRLDGMQGDNRAHQFQHADGRWYSAQFSPTREGGFVVTRVDITKRKQMEAAQREADALVQQVLEACPVMIMMNELENGEVIYRSPATKALFGEVDSVCSFYADISDRGRYLAQLRKHGYVDDFEYLARRPNGKTFWAAVSGRLIDYQGRQVIVSHTRDLTDRLAIEAELERQREIVHQSEKLSALGELLAGVAHELNNPLSVVVGQSLLLKETAHDTDVMTRAEKIGGAADRCARIVKSFLAMARQEPARTENINVNQVFESALEVTGYSIRSSDIDVCLQLGSQLPAIWGDPDQLGQVFSNLLINAQQALSQFAGRRKIKVATRYDRKHNNIIIKIADTGPGIPEKIRSRIFEPFFTTKEIGTGTGIGLAFCHRVIESHGGAIRVESQLGQGTTFFIRLPASGNSEQICDAVEQSSSREAKLNILVIDDEPDVADLMTEILRNDGHQVVRADSGPVALRQIARHNFSVILSDLNMPGLDGADLFQKLSEHNPELVTRVAFVTGDTMSPKAQVFLSKAGRPYLEKPIRPGELRQLVADLVSAN